MVLMIVRFMMEIVDKNRYCAILLVLGMVFMTISCNNSSEQNHRGEYKIEKQLVLLDSILIDAQETSGRGNFYMQDSAIYFADTYYMSVFRYDWDSVACVGRYFNKGQGPNEIPSFMYAAPLKNGKGECWLLDTSLGIYSYQQGDFQLTNRGLLDFGWKNVQKGNFNSPSVYSLMEMIDFGMQYYCMNDSTVLAPVNLIGRYFDDITIERYEKGHILAEIDSKQMKVRKVFGHFPDRYKDEPTPSFEFFQYDIFNDTLFVNHATDSLIYVYEYPDKLLYTMGYEIPDINRDYTVGLEQDFQILEKDLQKVGVNTGLLYIPELDVLCRTAMKQFATQEVVLQMYSEGNLIFESEMPQLFTLLGYCNDYFYGVRLMPKEDSGNMSFVFYRFKVQDL